MAAGGRISLEKGFMSLSRKTIWIGAAHLTVPVACLSLHTCEVAGSIPVTPTEKTAGNGGSLCVSRRMLDSGQGLGNDRVGGQ